MENIVYYFLIIFGAVLVWINFNDLRKLKENNAQWAEIEQQSHLYNQDNYAEAEKLVKKLQKIIPFLAKFSLFNGVFAIVGSLLGLVGLFNNIHLNLNNVGSYSSVFLFMLSVLYIVMASGLESDFIAGIKIDFNRRYKTIIGYITDNKCNMSLQNNFNDNLFDGVIFTGIEDDYNTMILFRRIIFFSLNIFLFLLLSSIFFDTEFRQMIYQLY